MTTVTVRPLRESDLAEVTALRSRCFQHTRHQDSEAQARHFRTIFLDNPWRDSGVEALVCEDARGRIVGFRGLVGRPMQFRGEPILAAVSSQLMVDPDARGGGVAFALMRASLKGSQDLMFADLANQSAVMLWKAVRGLQIDELGFEWRLPLKPMQWMASRLGGSGQLRWQKRLARPVLKWLDSLAAKIPNGPFERLPAPPAINPDLDQHLAILSRLKDHYRLVPEYNRDSLAWLLDRTREALDPGEALACTQVTNGDGTNHDFYLAAFRAGGNARVLQMFAGRSGLENLVDSLRSTAGAHGCREISARAHPGHLPDLARPPGLLMACAPRFLVASNRRELIDTIRTGDAWLSDLDGEWWMGF